MIVEETVRTCLEISTYAQELILFWENFRLKMKGTI